MSLGGWSEPAYEEVARLCTARTGLTFALNRIDEVEAGIRRAMKRTGIQDVLSYCGQLRAAKSTFDDLTGELTVGETYFFRDQPQFEFIREEVLPEIRERRGPEHVARVWSAGCASGEEAYSLAILFDERGEGDRVHILGTDLSRIALAKAQEATYGEWSFRGTDRSIRHRYFRRSGDRYILDERIRQCVGFEYLNLALDSSPSFANGTWGMDLILCRNVLIYLDRQTIRSVARRLLECLASGGWLVTGASDPPLGDEAPFWTTVTPVGVLYRRAIGPLPASALPIRSLEESSFQGAQPKQFSDSAPVDAIPKPSQKPQHLEDSFQFSSGMVPTGTADILKEALATFARGDYAGVLKVTSTNRDDPRLAALHIRASANQDGPELAARAAQEAVSSHPLSTELRVLQAVLLLDLGRDEEAVQAARQAIYLDPSLAVAHFTLGSILRRCGDVAGARRAYRNARDLCTLRPPDEELPLADGARAGRLAEAASVQMAILNSAQEPIS